MILTLSWKCSEYIYPFSTILYTASINMSNSLTKEVYSGAAATEFFYYYLLTAD